jgi:hypothetical protein
MVSKSQNRINDRAEACGPYPGSNLKWQVYEVDGMALDLPRFRDPLGWSCHCPRRTNFTLKLSLTFPFNCPAFILLVICSTSAQKRGHHPAATGRIYEPFSPLQKDESALSHSHSSYSTCHTLCLSRPQTKLLTQTAAYQPASLPACLFGPFSSRRKWYSLGPVR